MSISGDDSQDPPTFRHMMTISKSNASEPPEQMRRGATGRALHEYFHQQAYGAPSSFTTSCGDEAESWHFNGPRWWSEGTAEWVALVYPGFAGLQGDADDTAGWD